MSKQDLLARLHTGYGESLVVLAELTIAVGQAEIMISHVALVVVPTVRLATIGGNQFEMKEN